MYNGTIGGVGEGLQSFVSAYQNALNYQLQKSQAAALANYQDVMSQAASKNASTESAKQQSEAQYQQGMLANDTQKIPISQADANAKFLELGGTPAVQYYGFPPSQKQTQSDQVQSSQPSTQSQARGLVNPLPPGMVGPQPSPQMVQSSQQQAQQNQGLMNSPSPGSGMLSGPPDIVPTYQRNFNMEQMKIAGAKQNESDEKGTNQKWGIDPKTGMATMLSQGQYTGDALLGQQQKQAEIKNAAGNMRSANVLPVTQFNDSVSAKMARASASPMIRLSEFLNKPNMSPADKEAAFAAAQNVLHPETGQEATSIDDLLKAPGASDRLKNEFSKIQGKGLDDNTLNQAISAAATAHVANTKSMQQASAYAKQQAQKRGDPTDPGLNVDPNVLTAYQSASKILKNSSYGYTQPSQRSGNDWSNAWGLLGNNSQAASSHPMSGSVINYKGKNYNVGPNGNMVPVQ